MWKADVENQSNIVSITSPSDSKEHRAYFKEMIQIVKRNQDK